MTHGIGRRMGPAVFERKESGFFSRASVDRTQKFFDRFGGAAVTVARFVPVVRTFAPVAAGAGRMHWTPFTVFNVLGAVVWVVVVILLGYGLGHIPGVADVVAQYLDLVLIGIVVVSVVPVLVRAITLRRRSRAGSSGQPGDSSSRVRRYPARGPVPLVVWQIVPDDGPHHRPQPEC